MMNNGIKEKCMKDDCIFCKLANGIFPTNTVFEDDDFKIIMDINPVAKGHCLVLPKSHCNDAITADEQTLGTAMILAGRAAGALKKGLNCDGVNIIQNNGEAAGQSVFHLHVHVVPRYMNDGLILNKEPEKKNDDDLAATAELIKNNM